MKIVKNLQLVALIWIIPIHLYASDTLQFFPIMGKTSYNLKSKQWSKSFWTPLSYGLNNKVEVQCYPLLLPIMPNLGVKIAFPKLRTIKFQYCSNHSITYYTPWLKFWQSTGTGGIITPQISIPPQLMLENGISISYLLSPKHIVTTNLNFNFVLGEKINPIYTVDIPLVYPRFAPAFVGSVLSLKTNIQGNIYKRLNYLTSLYYFHLNSPEYNRFVETRFLIAYVKNNKLTLIGGTQIIYGQYPFGDQFNIIPYFDLIYSFGKK